MSHDRVSSVSGYLQHSVQVAENLGRVIGGQIIRRVLKISSVTLATLFLPCGYDIVLPRLSKPSRGRVERLCLSPGSPSESTQGDKEVPGAVAGSTMSRAAEQDWGGVERQGGKKKKPHETTKKREGGGLLEHARQVAARPALLAASRPCWLLAVVSSNACRGMGSPKWTYGEPSLGDGEGTGKCREACRLTGVIPRRDSRRGLSSTSEGMTVSGRKNGGEDNSTNGR